MGDIDFNIENSISTVQHFQVSPRGGYQGGPAARRVGWYDLGPLALIHKQRQGPKAGSALHIIENVAAPGGGLPKLYQATATPEIGPDTL